MAKIFFITLFVASLVMLSDSNAEAGFTWSSAVPDPVPQLVNWNS